MSSVEGLANSIRYIAQSDEGEKEKIRQVKSVVASSYITFFAMKQYFQNLIDDGHNDKFQDDVNRRMFIGPQTTNFINNRLGMNTPDQRSYSFNINLSEYCLDLLTKASREHCNNPSSPQCGGRTSRYRKRKTSRKRNQKKPTKKVKKTRKSRKIRR
jgi:hypothetical protein